MLNVRCGDLARLDTGDVVMVERVFETRIHGRGPESSETTMAPSMGPRLGWRPIEKTRVTHVMLVTAGSVVWEDVSAPTAAPPPQLRTKVGDRIGVRGQSYVVVDVESPGPALRAAFPNLAELVVACGERGSTRLLRVDRNGRGVRDVEALSLSLRAAVLHALSAPGAPTQAAVARAVAPAWGVTVANATTALNAWLRGKRKSIPLHAVEALLGELGLAVVPQPNTGATVVHDPHPSRAGLTQQEGATLIVPVDPAHRGGGSGPIR